MKIWIVSAYDPLPVIDDDIRLLRYGSIARALEADGHQVVFWTSTFAHWRKQSRFAEDTTRKISPNFKAEFLFAPGYSSNVSLARIRHNFQLARAFTRRTEHESGRPDVILAEIPCLELAEAAAQFASRHNIPFVCDIQDIWPDVYLTWLPRYLHPPGRWMLQTEYARLRRILAVTSGITAVSQAYLDWSERWMNRKLGETDQVFPLGYTLPTVEIREKASECRDTFRKRHGLEPGALLVTFLGQFATSYDVETIVESARILEKNTALPPYQIVLAGGGDKDAMLRRKANGLRSITFTGWLEHTDTVCLLESSHVALAAYTSTAAQSLPYKPFEYMAFGLPIINSLPGELPEIITHNRIGLNYQAESPESLANAIVHLITDSVKRNQCAQQSRLLFEQEYNAEIIYTKMSRYLASCASPIKQDSK